MIAPHMGVQGQPVTHGDAMQVNQSDVMQASRLTTLPPAPELDGEEEIEPPLLWVALDKERGLMICYGLKLEVPAFVGTIFQSRVVRVMADQDGQVLCASSNRKAADVGRPARECGRVFGHTLGRTGSLNFTRYAARLKRDGHAPSEVLTRIFVEETPLKKAGTSCRRLQFEQDDLFRDQ